MEESILKIDFLLYFVIPIFLFSQNVVADISCCEKITNLEDRVKKIEDKAVESGSKKLYLSGQINRALLWVDNHVDSNSAYVDNDMSVSKLRIEGRANLNEDFSTGGVFEIQLTPNSSASVDVNSAETRLTAENHILIRKTELFFASKIFGQITIGHGSMASDNTMEETDLSKTTVVSWGASGPAFLAEGASFTDKATGAKYTTLKVGSIFDSADGLGRKDRILYSTPKYYGLSLHTSHGYKGSGDLVDVVAKFAGKILGTTVAADLAWAQNQNGATNKYSQIDGSVGMLFPISFTAKEGTGFNLYFGTAHRNWEKTGQKDGHLYLGKVGLIESLVSYGVTAFSIDWGTYQQMALDSNPSIHIRGKSWAASLVQQLDVVGTELYASYRKYKFNRKNSGSFYNPLEAVMVGARIRL